MGQGLRRRPRHADRRRARGAPARPAAVAGRRLSGVEREDEMVAAFDYCLHGRGGAAPSIDTAMHGLVDAAHVDHLHPDSGIALATAADGQALTREAFGDRVAWVGWRRPGSSSASTSRRSGATTRRRSAASSAATGSPPGARRPRLRGELARDHRDRRAVHRRARATRSVRAADRRLRGAPEAPGRPRSVARTDRVAGARG